MDFLQIFFKEVLNPVFGVPVFCSRAFPGGFCSAIADHRLWLGVSVRAGEKDEYQGLAIEVWLDFKGFFTVLCWILYVFSSFLDFIGCGSYSFSGGFFALLKGLSFWGFWGFCSFLSGLLSGKFDKAFPYWGDLLATQLGVGFRWFWELGGSVGRGVLAKQSYLLSGWLCWL